MAGMRCSTTVEYETYYCCAIYLTYNQALASIRGWCGSMTFNKAPFQTRLRLGVTKMPRVTALRALMPRKSQRGKVLQRKAHHLSASDGRCHESSDLVVDPSVMGSDPSGHQMRAQQ